MPADNGTEYLRRRTRSARPAGALRIVKVEPTADQRSFAERLAARQAAVAEQVAQQALLGDVDEPKVYVLLDENHAVVDGVTTDAEVGAFVKMMIDLDVGWHVEALGDLRCKKCFEAVWANAPHAVGCPDEDDDPVDGDLADRIGGLLQAAERTGLTPGQVAGKTKASAHAIDAAIAGLVRRGFARIEGTGRFRRFFIK